MPSPTDRFYLYDISTMPGPTLLKEDVAWPRADGGAIAGLSPDLQYLLMLPVEPQPPFDPITEKLVETTTPDFDDSEVAFGWDVVALTDNEIRCNEIYEGLAPIFLALNEAQRAFLEVLRARTVACLLTERDADAARVIVEESTDVIPFRWEPIRQQMLEVFDAHPPP